MDTMNQLTVDTYCQNCGFSRAVVGEHGDRCTDCGRFASDDPICCARHEVRESPYSTGECPYCERERDIRAREQEMHQRRANPRMHNTVDAPRW